MYVKKFEFSGEKLKSSGSHSLLISVRKFCIPKAYFHFLSYFKIVVQGMTRDSDFLRPVLTDLVGSASA